MDARDLSCSHSILSPAEETFAQVQPVLRLLHDLRQSFLLLPEDWASLTAATKDQFESCESPDTLLERLVAHELLTPYQVKRIQGGEMHGLVLGNYRVLDRLGAGAMGVVYKGEHRRMRRLVAIKVASVLGEEDLETELRFLAEIRAVSQLHHPNIVSAFDAGDVSGDSQFLPTLYYYVMEFLPGLSLHDLVQKEGPLAPERACDVISQIANGLARAHAQNLIHRDIKPSNIMVTPEGQAKLLDFGLVRHEHQRFTKPGVPLGTLAYMAPEQIHDASTVDGRVDVYGLGTTLFWCLTGKPPFRLHQSLGRDIVTRLTEGPAPIRSQCPGLPAALEEVVLRMMATNPADRLPTPEAVRQALLPFLRPAPRLPASTALLNGWAPPGPAPTTEVGVRRHRILIVDDQESLRSYCKMVLQMENAQCDEAADGVAALEALQAQPYDLVVMDCDMPRLSGPEAAQRLRESPPCPNLKVILVSGEVPSDRLAQQMLAGVDDFLAKPFSAVQLQARARAALRLKDAQDRSDELVHQLLSANRDLEQALNARDSDLIQARNAIVLALAKLAEYRDTETGAHLHRLARYCRVLAEEAARTTVYAEQIDANFIEMLTCCAPLHDIGKVGVPDDILLKPGKLTAEERLIMQTHTIIGADTLLAVARQNRFATAMLHTAATVARHHHERFDGTGYPDRLKGADIPLAARLVAIADVYDALRSRRPYKPSLPHIQTLELMLPSFPGQFDPALLQAFRNCAPQMASIFAECVD